MRIRVILLVCILGVMASFVQVQQKLFKVPRHWPKPVVDFRKQPLVPSQVLLGRVLFYDPILSRNNTISCSSCHLSYTAFTHVDHALSHGIDDRIGTRNAPALMNMAWSPVFMWDGAHTSLRGQVFSPITHPQEMDETPERLMRKLQESSLYPGLVGAAFGDRMITPERLSVALEQFMLTFVSARSKYDRVKAGRANFSVQEQKGYRIFQQNCASCHTEPLFTNYRFERNGLTPDTLLRDSGRAHVTRRPEDAFKFKVPTLRNIEFSRPYMHDGRFASLTEVLAHYSSSFPSAAKPLNLTSENRTDLMAFLLTLTDEQFLFDTNYTFPRHILLAP